MTNERQPLHYDRIHYNGVIHWLETQWNRKLTDHERNVLIEGYRYGRLTEMYEWLPARAIDWQRRQSGV